MLCKQPCVKNTRPLLCTLKNSLYYRSTLVLIISYGNFAVSALYGGASFSFFFWDIHSVSALTHKPLPFVLDQFDLSLSWRGAQQREKKALLMITRHSYVIFWFLLWRLCRLSLMWRGSVFCFLKTSTLSLQSSVSFCPLYANNLTSAFHGGVLKGEQKKTSAHNDNTFSTWSCGWFCYSW